MRTILLPILFFVSSIGFAQDKIFSISGVGTMATNKSHTLAYGLDLSAIRKIKGGFYMGLNAGVMNFKGYASPYIPVALNMTYFPLKNRNANAPYITFQPGYGILDYKVRSVNFITQESITGDGDGGFTYFAGIGMMTKTAGKTRANFSLGYSSFGGNYVYSDPASTFGNIKYYNKTGSFGTITLKVGLTLQK
jgi:hypothetical protein